MLRLLLSIFFAVLPMSPLLADNGIETRPSAYTVAETVGRLEAVLQSRNIMVFTKIDQAAEAAKVGLVMPPTQLLVFGNPRAGTPLMLMTPLIGLDLPLKVLIWEDRAGKVSVSFNSSDFLRQRYGLNDEQAKPLSAVEGLVAAALK